MGGRTRVVAVTAACPAIGVRTEVAAIARKVHALPHRGTGVEPLIVVDASAAAPYLPLDLDTMGSDVMVLSAAAWGGPSVGALVFRTPDLLDRLPAASLDGSARGPERLEVGDAPYAVLAGLVASIDYLADLDDTAYGPRRDRVLISMSSVRSHQDELTDYLVSELRFLPGVMVIGDPPRRIPIVAFTVVASALTGSPGRVGSRSAVNSTGILLSEPPPGDLFSISAGPVDDPDIVSSPCIPVVGRPVTLSARVRGPGKHPVEVRFLLKARGQENVLLPARPGPPPKSDKNAPPYVEYQAAWKPTKPRARKISQALRAYAAFATSAARGAVREVP